MPNSHYFDQDSILEWNIPPSAQAVSARLMLNQAADHEKTYKRLRTTNPHTASFHHMLANIWRGAACLTDANTVVDYYTNQR